VHRLSPVRQVRRLAWSLRSGLGATVVLLGTAGGIARAQDTTCVAVLDTLHSVPAPTAALRKRALGCADSADAARRADVWNKVSEEIARLGRLPWLIPEYHDEQRLVVGTALGPMAHLFASPYLNSFKYPWQLQEQTPNGIVAAIVYVDAPPGASLPGPYSALHLAGGMNCIWLQLTPASSWRGFVTQPSGPGGPCRPPTPPFAPLAVLREQASGMGFDDYPAAARFGQSTDGRTLLGFKCLNGWCQLGPAGATSIPALPAAAVPGATREVAVRGWYDIQQLAKRNAAGVLVPGPRAVVVPAANLDQFGPAAYTTWRRVATITFIDTPAGTKYVRWGLRFGENPLEAMYAGGKWVYRLHFADGSTRVWDHVIEMKHRDAAVPGTVRFRWTVLDESIWIPCGAGCCQADGE